MSEESSGCGCCPECTGEPDCECGCPECTCGDYYYESCCCDDDDCCCHDHDCCDGSGFVLSAVSSIVGMVFLGILAVLYGIFYLNNAWSFTTIVETDLGFMILCVAAVLAFTGVLAFKAGDVTEGILFSLVGFSALLEESMAFLGFGALAYFDLILMIVLIVVVIILLKGRDITFGISVLLFLAGLVFVIFLDGTGLAPVAGGISFLISGIVLLYVAISDWLFVETGTDLPIL